MYFVNHRDSAIGDNGRINLANDGGQRGQKGLLGLRSSNHEREIVLELLEERDIQDRWDGLIQRTLLDILDNPDDFQGRARNRYVRELLADRIFAREVFPCHRLIDDRNPGLRGVLVFSEVAPAR